MDFRGVDGDKINNLGRNANYFQIKRFFCLKNAQLNELIAILVE